MDASCQLVPEYSQEQYYDRFSSILATHESVKGFKARVKVFCELFLAKPYLAPALGEGPEGEIDQHPLYRDDAFDCVSYVITVLSLALSHSVDDFIKNILFFQYKNSKIDYINRRHFMELDFDQALTQSGILSDITSSFVDQHGKVICQSESVCIDQASWFAQHTAKSCHWLKIKNSGFVNNKIQTLNEKTKNIAKEVISKAYLPIDKLLSNQDHFMDSWPEFSLVEMVRVNWQMQPQIGTDMIISHTGWVIKKDQDLILYHASSKGKKVIAVPLIKYLSTIKQGSTLKGLSVWSCL